MNTNMVSTSIYG